uniref:Uncharacterized protein n=1 Tax=Acrobeloides nanus TaxID=290746 RepID=A0A914EGE7_9BILA
MELSLTKYYQQVHQIKSSFPEELNWKPDKFDAQLSHYSSDMLEFIHLCLQSIDNRPKYDELINTNLYKIYSEKKSPLDVAKMMENIEESSEPKSN